MSVLRLSDKSCSVHHHLIKNLSHVQRTLNYIKYAVNLTKYSSAFHLTNAAASTAHFQGVGNRHPLLSSTKLQTQLEVKRQ